MSRQHQSGAKIFPVLALAMLPLSASPLENPTGHWNAQQWNRANGLQSDNILAISSGPQGYLWLGTSTGLKRFDGLRFTVPPALASLRGSEAVILSLAHVPGEPLWIATQGGGILSFDGHRLARYGAESGLVVRDIYSLLLDRGKRLWVGTAQGVYRKEGQRFIRAGGSKDSDGAVWSLSEGPDGNIWAASFGGGVLQISGQTLQVQTRYDTRHGLQESRVRAILAQRNGDILAAVPGQGIYRLGAGEQRFVPLAATPRPDLLDVWRMLEDPHGGLWVAGGSAGLLHAQAGRWEARFGTADAAVNRASAFIVDLYADRTGSLWAGSRNGLIRLRDEPITLWDQRDGLPSNMVGAMLETSDKEMVVGTWNAGAVRWNRQLGRGSPLAIGRDQKVFALLEHQQHLWLGTASGLVALLPSGLRRFRQSEGLPSDTVFAIAPATANSLWVGTLGGLCLLENYRCTSPSFADRLPRRGVFVIRVTAGGDLWLGFSDGGVCRVAGNAVQCLGESWGDIFDIETLPDSSLWVAAYGGLYWLDRVPGGESFSSGQLLSDPVYAIATGQQNDVWLSGRPGIWRTTVDELRRYRQSSPPMQPIEAWTQGHGLPDTEMAAGSQPAGLLSRDGAIWFANSAGALRIDTTRPAAAPVPAVGGIESIVIDGHTTPPATAVDLPAGVRRLEFHFTAMELSSAGVYRFRYRLDGFDPDWILTGRERSAHYTVLPQGHYTFRLEAAGPDGVFRPLGEPLAVKQQPFFYQTAWFLALLLSALGGAVWLAIRYRTSQIRQRYDAVLNERTRIARDLHDTLLGDFTGHTLQLGAVVTREELRGLIPLVTRMEQSLRLARQAIQNLRTSDDLHPSRFWDELEATIRQTTEPHNLRCEFHVLPARHAIPPHTRDCVHRVVVEAVRNVVKHAKAQSVQVHLHLNGSSLEGRITDDGCGFRPLSPSVPSFGLTGMRERVEHLEGHWDCKSSPTGTTIQFRLPTHSSAVRS